jgi:hypothetical protein
MEQAIKSARFMRHFINSIKMHGVPAVSRVKIP